jgi:ADP-ribose pyrophosphatase
MSSFNGDPPSPNDAHLLEEFAGSSPIYAGRILGVKVDTVFLPNGKTATREIVEHPGAVAVVPVTDKQEIVFVRQYRYAVGQSLLEIPAGRLEEGESPEECAARELREEIQMEAGRLIYLTGIYVAAAYSQEMIRIFLGTQLTPVNGSPDEDEFLEVVTIPAAAARLMAYKGEFADAKTQVAVALATMGKAQCEAGL